MAVYYYVTNEEFNEKYVAQGRQLFLLALRLTGSSADAEDAVQDVLERLWARRAELDTVESPQAYAQTLLRRRCLDILDSNRLRQTDSLSPLHSSLPTDFDTRNRAMIVLRLISELPEPQRLILQMRDVEGREIAEIEAATGLSAGNIRVILSRARAAIKSRFSL